jgi:hypothetical protein
MKKKTNNQRLKKMASLVLPSEDKELLLTLTPTIEVLLHPRETPLESYPDSPWT